MSDSHEETSSPSLSTRYAAALTRLGPLPVVATAAGA
jgi:hypothetical protein